LKKNTITLIASILMLLMYIKTNAQKIDSEFKRHEIGIDIANALTFLKETTSHILLITVII
jgi:hypothetical protein